MKTITTKMLEIIINGTIVFCVLLTIAGFAGWLELKKESSWPWLVQYKDKGYWVTGDQNKPATWVVLGVQQK